LNLFIFALAIGALFFPVGKFVFFQHNEGGNFKDATTMDIFSGEQKNVYAGTILRNDAFILKEVII